MESGSIFVYPRKRKSPRVNPEMAAKIKALLPTGMSQHDIAALFRINQGRVSEINTGERFSEVKPTQLELAFS